MAKIKTQAAQCAKEVKQILTKAFPNVKFSVKSENYTGGNSVRITWNFGPTVEQVEKYTSIRQHGWFDGMTDMYNYTGPALEVTDNAEIKEMASSKYVFEQRNYTLPEELKQNKYRTEGAFRIELMQAICKAYNVDYAGHDTNLYPGNWSLHNTVGMLAYRMLQKTVFTSDNVKFLGLERTDVTGGFAEDFYLIRYEDLTTNTAATAINERLGEKKVEQEAVTTSIDSIEIINYSEKSFIVVGNTFPIKEHLKDLGGKFNAFLTHPVTKQRVKGWVFAISEKDELIDKLNLIKN